MQRRGFSVVAVTLLLLAGGALARAAVIKHQVSQTVRLATISLSQGYPNPGSSSVDAGLVSGSLGSGASSQKTTITGHPKPSTYTFTALSTAFYAHGAIRSAITGTATIESGGSVKLAGHGRYVRGTDSYRGAHGSFSLIGTIPPANPNQPQPTVVHVTGTITY